jgi:hypothetical protein
MTEDWSWIINIDEFADKRRFLQTLLLCYVLTSACQIKVNPECFKPVAVACKNSTAGTAAGCTDHPVDLHIQNRFNPLPATRTLEYVHTCSLWTRAAVILLNVGCFDFGNGFYMDSPVWGRMYSSSGLSKNAGSGSVFDQSGFTTLGQVMWLSQIKHT